MDNDELRRGRPTSHVKFGEATAILAAQAQLVLAFEVVSEIDAFHPELDAVGQPAQLYLNWELQAEWAKQREERDGRSSSRTDDRPDDGDPAGLVGDVGGGPSTSIFWAGNAGLTSFQVL